MDPLERSIRRNVLLALISELYQQNLSDVIAVKEWLQRKLDEPAEPLDDELRSRCTNRYLCQRDQTRWDAQWSCMCNDRCPTCDGVVEPYASTNNADQREVIHNREAYDRANARHEKCS